MCIFHTASWSSALTHHNISQSWFILPKLVQNVLKVGSFSKSWFKMCPKLVHFPKVGSFSKSWYEMCQNQVNNYISNVVYSRWMSEPRVAWREWPAPRPGAEVSGRPWCRASPSCPGTVRTGPSTGPCSACTIRSAQMCVMCDGEVTACI